MAIPSLDEIKSNYLNPAVARGRVAGVWALDKIKGQGSLGMWLLGTVLGRSVLTGVMVCALFFGWLAFHDRKVVSRVIEKSQREASKDVALSKGAYSASISGTGGVRSSYRRD